MICIAYCVLRIPLRNTQYAILILTLALLGLSCSSSTSEPGQVEVRVWDHREAIGDFRSLQLNITALSLHPAGLPRTEGWIELEPTVQSLDLTQYVGGPEATIAQTRVKAGSYNAVRLVIAQASGVLTDGQPVEVKVNFEVAALDFQVSSDQPTILGLDLVVLDLSDHAGQGYELNLREAVVD
jgi:hypothetical protein